jgi:hypothetical protein
LSIRKVNQDEREVLEGLFYQDGFRLFEQLVGDLCDSFDRHLATYNLDGGTERLLRLKSEADGARKLKTAIIDLKKQFRPK